MILRYSIIASTLLVALVVRGATYGRTLVLGGGSIDDTNTEVWNKIIALAGGRGVARIGIITAASENAVTAGRTYKTLLQSFGVAETYWVPVHEQNTRAAYDEEVVDNIKRMTAIFFGGGAQQRIIVTLLDKKRKPTPVLKAVRKLFNRGMVVAGTSAGAMVMPNKVTMVSGTSYSGIVKGASKIADSTNDTDLTFDDRGGLGFISTHTIDSHFHERGRQGRLIRMISDTRQRALGTDYGLGIDENTILVVTDVGTPDQTGQVYGRGGVMIVDLSMSVVDSKARSFRLMSIYTDYLTSGDIVNLTDHTVTVSSAKKPLKGNETADYAASSTNIFQGALTAETSAFYAVSRSLFNSRVDSITYGTTAEDSPRYYVILSEDHESAGYMGPQPAGLCKISYSRLKVELRAHHL